jgi:ribosome biogenesis protein BRX1
MKKSLLSKAQGSDAIQKTATNASKNKQRLLLLASRGIISSFRHLMNDLNLLLPHSKKESKWDSKGHLTSLNELCELCNTNNCLFFETRKKELYWWLSKTPNGPSVKFNVLNVFNMSELKLTGNCLKGSRAILSFDAGFDSEPFLKLTKEILTQTFGTPTTSRKKKPFFDHVFTFTWADGRIWFRNYQIIQDPTEADKMSLEEIGPRFVLQIVRIFDGSFGGSTIYENSEFKTAQQKRIMARVSASAGYKQRQNAIASRQEKLIQNQLPKDPLEDIFKS